MRLRSIGQKLPSHPGHRKQVTPREPSNAGRRPKGGELLKAIFTPREVSTREDTPGLVVARFPAYLDGVDLCSRERNHAVPCPDVRKRPQSLPTRLESRQPLVVLHLHEYEHAVRRNDLLALKEHRDVISRPA